MLNLDWLSQSPAVRSALRRAGVTRLLSAGRQLLGTPRYEAKVDVALSNSIRLGDCVWDVGANVGLYTARFASAVGPHGKVVAFEPIDTTFNVLSERVAGMSHVQTLPVALGANAETVLISVNDDPTSPVNSLARRPESDGGRTQHVRIETGDELIRSGRAPLPNVIKIDAEGFEEEVLWGIRDTLRLSDVRVLVIEVHFAVLETRGLRRAPQRIASLLDDLGFERMWIDASHLLATRGH